MISEMSRALSRRSQILFVGAFAFCSIVFVALRLYQIASVGVQTGDGFEYIDVAQRWVEGDFYANRHGFFRPAAYAIQALALWAFPEPKLSLKLLNCFADFVALSCVYFSVFALTRSRWYSLLAFPIYTANWWALKYARGEFVHTLAACFLALGFFAYVLAQGRLAGRKHFVALWICGISCGIAGNIHPSVAIVGAAFALTLPAFHLLRKDRRPGDGTGVQIIGGWCALLLGFITPYLAAAAYFGLPYLVDHIFIDAANQRDYVGFWGGDSTGLPVVSTIWSIYSIVALEQVGSILLAPIFTLTVFVSASSWLLVRSRADLRLVSLHALGALLCCACFAATFDICCGGSELSYYRLYLHVWPIICIQVLLAGHLLYRLPTAILGQRGVQALVVSGILAAALPFYSKLWLGELASIYQPNAYEWVQTVLHDKVGEAERLLIMPYIYYSNDRAFERGYYFGEDAEYIRFSGGEFVDLPSLTRDRQIAYLYWADRAYDVRLLNPRVRQRLPGDYYGMSDDERGYSPERERAMLDEFMEAHGAHRLARSHFGEIFELARHPSK